jgi:hypothetical protein
MEKNILVENCTGFDLLLGRSMIKRVDGLSQKVMEALAEMYVAKLNKKEEITK